METPMRTFLNAAGQSWGETQLGRAVNTAAVAGELGRIALATSATTQLLGVVVKVGAADARGQVITVACEDGDVVTAKAGATLTPGTTVPFLTADANSAWVPCTTGQTHALRVLWDGRAVIAAGDEFKAIVNHGVYYAA